MGLTEFFNTYKVAIITPKISEIIKTGNIVITGAAAALMFFLSFVGLKMFPKGPCLIRWVNIFEIGLYLIAGFFNFGAMLNLISGISLIAPVIAIPAAGLILFSCFYIYFKYFYEPDVPTKKPVVDFINMPRI